MQGTPSRGRSQRHATAASTPREAAGQEPEGPLTAQEPESLPTPTTAEDIRALPARDLRALLTATGDMTSFAKPPLKDDLH